MPRPTEIIQAEEISTPKSPLRRSCRIVAVSSPVPTEAKPIKGRRLSSNLDKDEVDQKTTGKRASSVTKEIVGTKTEPAKTRSRRLSNTSDSSTIDENKPGTRTRSSQLVEDEVQETAKPIRRRRSSATIEEAPKPVRTRRSSATSESSVTDNKEQLTPVMKTRGKTDSKQEDTDQQQRSLRSRRSASRDLSEDNGETKRVTRSRRSSTDTLDEIPTNTPIKSLSVVLDTVLEDTKVENDINKTETDKTNLDLSIIYETSFAEEEKSKTPSKSEVVKEKSVDSLTIEISGKEIQTTENTAVRKSPRLQEKLQKCQFGEHSPHKKCSCMDGINSDNISSPKHKRSPQDLKSVERNDKDESTSNISSKELAVIINKTEAAAELSKIECVEGEKECNTSNTSESSNKENIDEQQPPVMMKTVVNRVSNVFRPKNIEYSFSEPMEVDTTIDLNVSKLDKSVAVPNSNETVSESFSLKLSATYIEIPEEELVTETSEVDSVFKELKSDTEDNQSPEKTEEKEAEIGKIEEDTEKKLEKDEVVEEVEEPEDDRFSETKDMSDDYEFCVLSEPEENVDKNNLNTSNSKGVADEIVVGQEKVDTNIEKSKEDIVDVNVEESQQNKIVAESENVKKSDSDTEELVICEESKQNEIVNIEMESKDDSINEKSSKNDVEEIDIESEEAEIKKIEETDTPSKLNVKELKNDTTLTEELKADQFDEPAEVSINVVDKNDHLGSEIDNEDEVDIETISSEEAICEKENENKKSDVEESELKDAELKESKENEKDIKMECTVGENVEEKVPDKDEEINPVNTDAEVEVENLNNEKTLNLEEEVKSNKSKVEKSNEDSEADDSNDKSVNEDIAIELNNSLLDKKGCKELVNSSNVENDVEVSNKDDREKQENVENISNEQMDMEKSFQDTIQDDDDLVSEETVENEISTVESFEKKIIVESPKEKLESVTEDNISTLSQKKKKKRNVSTKENENLNSKKTLEEIIGRHEIETSKNGSDKEKISSKGPHRQLEDIINGNSPSSTNFSLEKWFGNKTSNNDSSPVIKKIKSKRIDPGINLNSEELEKPKLTTNTEKLDAFLDEKMAEFDTEELDDESSYESSNQEENSFLDDMAEEGEEDSPSEDSNEIICEGDPINTDSERSEDDDYENDSSFICDDEDEELLPGDEYDLEVEKTSKKSRILNVEDRNEDIIKIKRKPEPEPKKRKTRIIKMDSSSEDEEKLIDLTKEDENATKKGRKSSITIIENINVKEIKDTDLSNRINQLVDSFCTSIPQKGGVSMNLSLEYAGHSSPEQTEKSKKKSKFNKRRSTEEESIKKLKEPRLSVSLIENVNKEEKSQNISLDIPKSTSDPPKNKSKGKKRKSGNEEELKEPRLSVSLNENVNKEEQSLDIAKSASDPPKTKSKGKKRKSSTEEETVPCKQPTLIEIDTSKKSKKKRLRNKQKRNNEEMTVQNKENASSSEDISEVKKKKLKKSTKSKRTEVKSPSKDIPSTSGNYLDLQRETFGLVNQLVTDVRNRSRRTVRPSTAIDGVENWNVELNVEMKPSTSAVTKKEMKDFKKYHAKDFRNQMLYNSGRVNRVETTKMLQKKGAYN